MGVSGLLTAVILVSFSYPINNLPWVVASVATAAIVWSARIIVSNHTNKELIVGFIIGLGTQIAAFLWVN